MKKVKAITNYIKVKVKEQNDEAVILYISATFNSVLKKRYQYIIKKWSININIIEKGRDTMQIKLKRHPCGAATTLQEVKADDGGDDDPYHRKVLRALYVNYGYLPMKVN